MSIELSTLSTYVLGTVPIMSITPSHTLLPANQRLLEMKWNKRRMIIARIGTKRERASEEEVFQGSS